MKSVPEVITLGGLVVRLYANGRMTLPAGVSAEIVHADAHRQMALVRHRLESLGRLLEALKAGRVDEETAEEATGE